MPPFVQKEKVVNGKISQKEGQNYSLRHTQNDPTECPKGEGQHQHRLPGCRKSRRTDAPLF